MILFIAPNPYKVAEREGFLQRVAAIDQIFFKEKKLYFEDIVNAQELAKALKEARLIYVHSIYQAQRILFCYPLFAHKIVTDMHGVVPEEEEFSGNNNKSKEMAAVEKVVFDNGKIFVAVSQAMADHFTNKYRLPKSVSWIILPIFEAQKHDMSILGEKDNVVVYAGGTQSWQNVKKMISAINKSANKYRFVILTHNTDAFDDIKVMSDDKLTLKTVPSSEVPEYYKRASLGFILRDDILVNNVSCPTKLIEYLNYGVVPIVLSPDIGDFNTLGYSYITLNDFLRNKYDAHKLHAAAQNNFLVIQKLITLTESGTHDLLGLLEEGSHTDELTSREEQLLGALTLSSFELRELQDAFSKYREEMGKHARTMTKYAETVAHYEKLVDEITHSKRWILGDVIKKPWTAKRLLK